MPSTDPFWQTHRGGSGPVVVVHAINEDEERFAIFSCIENAEAWADELDDDWSCVFAPYVVDEPEFGNATRN